MELEELFVENTQLLLKKYASELRTAMSSVGIEANKESEKDVEEKDIEDNNVGMQQGLLEKNIDHVR